MARPKVMRHGPLPPALRAPRWSALTWVLVAAAAGAAACAIAGLYPQFDEGRLRWLLGLTSAPLAACVVGVALRRRTALGAAFAALGLAAILGVASTLFPLLALSFGVGSHGPDPAWLPAGLIFGLPFGAVTGLCYGVPLAVLTALAHRRVRARTHESSDRAAVLAGLWLAVVGAFAVGAGTLADRAFAFGHSWTGPVVLGVPVTLHALIAACAAALGIAFASAAYARRRTRARWLKAVASGREPSYRVRTIDPRDGAEALPRLSEGGAVIEWVPARDGAAHAYRVATEGVPVAVVDAPEEAPLAKSALVR